MMTRVCSALALVCTAGLLCTPALAQEGTLTQDQLLTSYAIFGNGTINSVTTSGIGVLIDGNLGDEAGDFSRIVVGADFFGAPLDFSGNDSIAVNVRVTELNVPYLSCKAFVQTPDGNGGYGFNEGADIQVGGGQTTLVSVPLAGVLNTDQLSRFGIQFFGPGPLFPGEEHVVIQIDPTTPGPCNVADLAVPFGTLDFFDVLLYLQAFSGGCQSTGSVGDDPYSMTQTQISEMNAIVGTRNSASTSGTGVDFHCTYADGGGFTQVALAYNFGSPVNMSANDTIELEVTLIAGDAMGCRIVTKDGPSYTYTGGDIVNLAAGDTGIIYIDLSTLALPDDVREVDIEFYSGAIGDLNSTEFDVHVRPVNLTCGPADLAVPFGALDFFDLQAFLSAFSAGCP